jgi:hypothetical protein
MFSLQLRALLVEKMLHNSIEQTRGNRRVNLLIQIHLLLFLDINKIKNSFLLDNPGKSLYNDLKSLYNFLLFNNRVAG